MTKLEVMTNDEMTNTHRTTSSSFWLCASFVIRDSCFVIAMPQMRTLDSR
jgi:hypothetical protein